MLLEENAASFFATLISVTVIIHIYKGGDWIDDHHRTLFIAHAATQGETAANAGEHVFGPVGRAPRMGAGRVDSRLAGTKHKRQGLFCVGSISSFVRWTIISAAFPKRM